MSASSNGRDTTSWEARWIGVRLRVMLALSGARFLEFRGSRHYSAPPADVWRCGVCLGGLRFSEKPWTQTQLAIDGVLLSRPAEPFGRCAEVV